jgi:fatty-acyl-CoA synthase
MFTIVDAIADAPGRRDAQLGVLGPDGEANAAMSWSELDEWAARITSVLVSAGIGPGTRVGLLADTSAELVAAIEASWLAGAAVTVLPPPTTGIRRGYAGNLVAMVADAELDVILTDDAAAQSTLATEAPVWDLTHLVSRARACQPRQPYRPGRDDLALLQYSSGSTRDPRGIPVTHGHLAANLAAIRTASGIETHPHDRLLSWLPVYHDMGFVGFLALAMRYSHTLLLQSPRTFARRPASWLEAVSRYRANVSCAPNVAYGLVTPLLAGAPRMDLSSVRFLLTGSEPIDADLMARFAAAAAPHGLDPTAIAAGYGLAESTLAVSFSSLGTGLGTDRVDADRLERAGVAEPVPAPAAARELVIVGRAVPGTEIRVVDGRQGMPVPARVVGSVQIRGASVVGYYRHHVRPPIGTWFDTGDLGYLTESGDLVICGRAKDIVIAAGRNIHPQDIESAAASVAGVRPGGVAAFGVSGDRGERLVVAVELRGVKHVDTCRTISVAVRDQVGLTPASVVPVRPGGLPKTSSGKIRRGEARRLYLAGQLTQPAQHT